jgi:hypothetical protein
VIVLFQLCKELLPSPNSPYNPGNWNQDHFLQLITATKQLPQAGAEMINFPQRKITGRIENKTWVS